MEKKMMNTEMSGPGAVPAAPKQTPKPNSAPSTFAAQAKGESDRAFEAFRTYLELGPRRRIPAVARMVGASLRTVQRWAIDFDWRGRIKSRAAQSVEQYCETQIKLRRENLLDGAARAKAFRERQYALAEAILSAAEQYLERAGTDDLDQMSFADACKALEVASRLGQQAAREESADPSESARGLHRQLATLLDQACGENTSRNSDARAPAPADSVFHNPTK